MEKITNAKALKFVLDTCNIPAEIKDKLTIMYNGYTKKSTSKADTEKQELNAEIKAEILAVLSTASEPMQASAILKALDGEYSLPKVNALITQLKNDHKVIRTEEKGKAYFAVAETADEEEEG